MVDFQPAQAVAAVLAAAGACSLAALIWLRRRRGLEVRRLSRARQDVAGILEDASRLIAELEDLARRIVRRVDDRIGRLQELLEQADQRLGRLEELCRQAAARPSAASGSAAAPIARSEILRLSGQGLQSVEIARALQMDVGEVELVLNLQRPAALKK